MADKLKGQDEARAAQQPAGQQRPGESVTFFVNGRAAGELRDADFARRFFAIWLAPTTSEPRLRQQLIGAAQSVS